MCDDTNTNDNTDAVCADWVDNSGKFKRSLTGVTGISIPPGKSIPSVTI